MLDIFDTKMCIDEYLEMYFEQSYYWTWESVILGEENEDFLDKDYPVFMSEN